MNRILIVNVNWRGDVLFSTPFIRAIRKANPKSFIASLVVERCEPILRNNPYLDEIIIFDELAAHRGIAGKLKLICELRKMNFDVAILLHRSLSKTIFCALAGITERIGYHTRKRGWLLTKAIAQPMNEMHKVRYFLNLAEQIGISTDDEGCDFFTTKGERECIQSIFQNYGLRSDEFLVVINPGGNWHPKRWLKERFAQTADRLIEEYQAKVIITGAKKDIGFANEINAMMKNEALILCGETSLGELAALMSRVNLVIANDSGPMHIALSQGTKVIALFGPTSVEITGPYGKGNYIVVKKELDCEIPCYVPGCRDNHCMSDIEVDDVMGAVKKFMTNQ